MIRRQKNRFSFRRRVFLLITLMILLVPIAAFSQYQKRLVEENIAFNQGISSLEKTYKESFNSFKGVDIESMYISDLVYQPVGKSFNFKSKMNIERTTDLFKVQIPMPREDIKLVLENAIKYNIHPCLVFALIEVESSYNPNSKNSSSSATGYGQFIKSTGKKMYSWVTGKEDYEHSVHAKDPAIAIPMIFRYLVYIRDTVPDQSLQRMVERYHNGKDSIRIPYAKKIIRRSLEMNNNVRFSKILNTQKVASNYDSF